MAVDYSGPGERFDALQQCEEQLRSKWKAGARARRREVARCLRGSREIGPEHLLLGMISIPECIAAKALDSVGVNLSDTRQGIEDVVVAGNGLGNEWFPEEMTFTGPAKRVIELAFEEARLFNHRYIGTEHLLLGVLNAGESAATRILTAFGADSSKMRERIGSMLANG